jgi:hypothetical protein
MKPNVLLRSAVIVLVTVAAAGCAGGTGPDAGSSSSSGSGNSGARTIQSFPPETQAFMKAGLHQFSKRDPQWETTRAVWLAKGPAEADFLVQNMWAALLRFQGLDQPGEVERARHELVLIGEPSVPLLAAFIEGGTVASVVDEQTGERRDVVVDDFARQEASAVLGLIGAPSVGAVRDALARTTSKSGKRYALQTLGNIGDRGGAAAYEPLLQYFRGDDDVLRVEAVLSLRFFHDETTRSALIQALSDDDDLVRRKAAEALKNRRDTASVPYIRAAADRARADARLAEAAELDRSANWIEQHPK